MRLRHLLLAAGLLLGGATLARAQGSVQIISQTGTRVTVTPSCVASHNCLDVALLNIPHVICDSGCTGGGGGGGTSSTFGAAFPATGTAAGFIDASGNMAGGTLDAGGRLITTGAGGTFPVTGTFWQATQPVSGTFWQATQPVSGPLTDVELRATPVPISGTVTVTDGAGALNVIVDSGHVIIDTGSTTAVTGNVTVVQPTGTNLHAVLDTTSTTTATQATGTNLHTVTDATSVTTATLAAETTKVIGTVNQGTSPWIGAGGGTAGSAATGVMTVQGIASMTKLLVTPDANSAINVAQIGGTNTISAGVAGAAPVGGCVATNVATPCNPMNLGAQAVSSENSAATTAREVQLVADLVGKLIVLPYANPENFVSGVTSAMTGTTSTSLVSAPAGSLRNYITSISCVNSHATVGTFVNIQDGNGGTTIDTVAAAAVFGGTAKTYPTPLKQPTTATALYVADVTTGANVVCSAQGYKGL